MESITLIGAPGGGKGTVAKKLEEYFGYVTISTGSLLRAAREDGSEEGELIKKIQDEGGLVPDDITIKVLKNRILQSDCKNGFILDGFPRNTDQADALDDLLKEINCASILPIYINVPREIIEPRIVDRRTCPSCDAIYSISFEDLKPKKDGYCDKCNVELYQRSDDTKEAFDKRMDTYEEKTAPLINYYEKKGILVTIDGSKGSNDVFEQAKEIIEGY